MRPSDVNILTISRKNHTKLCVMIHQLINNQSKWCNPQHSHSNPYISLLSTRWRYQSASGSQSHNHTTWKSYNPNVTTFGSADDAVNAIEYRGTTYVSNTHTQKKPSIFIFSREFNVLLDCVLLLNAKEPGSKHTFDKVFVFGW